MKLELKHTKGYLDTELKVIDFQMYENGFRKKHTIKELVLTPSNLEIGLKDIDGVKNKPILHPLSDLMKYCDDLGFTPNRKLSELGFGMDNFDEDYTFEDFLSSDILNNSFVFIQKLLEWHFDIYGLIENGLAIDINTLNL
jgi:hypothetical protein